VIVDSLNKWIAALRILVFRKESIMAQPEQARDYVTTHFDKVLYTAKAHTTGGRDNGASHGDDGRLDVRLSLPGTPGTGTNPEQLFAAGWSACFLSAIKLVAGKKNVTLPSDVAIDAEVDLGITQGVHGLAARLNVRLPGLDRPTAQALADAAHQGCPYSRATHGNINATTKVVV
jgi:lipoyl-dependent peroxiredoxin